MASRRRSLKPTADQPHTDPASFQQGTCSLHLRSARRSTNILRRGRLVENSWPIDLSLVKRRGSEAHQRRDGTVCATCDGSTRFSEPWYSSIPCLSFTGTTKSTALPCVSSFAPCAGEMLPEAARLAQSGCRGVTLRLTKNHELEFCEFPRP